MVVLLIVFTISISVYINIFRSGFNQQKITAQALLEEVASDTRLNRKYLDEDFESDNIIIEKRVNKYQQTEGLILLEIIAKNKENAILGFRKELLLVEEM